MVKVALIFRMISRTNDLRAAGHGRTRTAGQAAAVARSDWSAILRHTIPGTPLADPRARNRVAALTCARLAMPWTGIITFHKTLIIYHLTAYTFLEVAASTAGFSTFAQITYQLFLEFFS